MFELCHTVLQEAAHQNIYILRLAVGFEKCSLSNKGAKVCRLYTTMNITKNWRYKQDGSMLSYCLCQILTLST